MVLSFNVNTMARVSSYQGGWINKRGVRVVLLSIVIVMLPVFVFSGRKNKIFVNAKATGNQTGSSEKPFKTIAQAMKEAKEDSEIHVANGTYKENVEMKKGVEIFGENKNRVIIEASDNGDPVVLMRHKTRIDGVTLQGGKYGIKIKGDAKVSIINVVIKNNSKDGIISEEGDARDERRVSISESEIKNNGRTGIFSHKRKLSIMDNNIHDNKSDGIDIEKNSSAWIEDNEVKDNGASGIKVRIDGSNIGIKQNNIRDNKREGIEVEFNGKAGKVSVAKSEIVENRRFGIARIQSFKITPESGKIWDKYLTFKEGKNRLVNNFGGTVSNIISR